MTQREEKGLSVVGTWLLRTRRAGGKDTKEPRSLVCSAVYDFSD